ncbi:MAG: alpha-L-rhamnosidase N-terminal domain-containing protein [Planctomycetaceae bacterium]|nr:alpha-L-rhamnosidase N-terminal domain-containing protein [Planctomycetaceae bacterium]
MRPWTLFPLIAVLCWNSAIQGSDAVPIAKVDFQSDAWRPIAVDLEPARWIWIPSGRTLSNTFVLFRKEIDVKGPLKSATGWITADSRYLLSVNGQRVQWGPAPSDPRHGDVDPINLTTTLTEGINVIGSEVLFYGLGDGTSPAGKPGFLFYLTLEYEDGRNESIISDQNWLVKLDRAHKPGQHKRWFLRSLQEEFDARLHPYGWDTADFQPDSSWLPAMVLNCSPAKPASTSGYDMNDLIERANPDKSSLRIREIPLIREIEIPAMRLAESGVVKWKRDPNDWFDMRIPDCFDIQLKPVPSMPVIDPSQYAPNEGIFLTFEWEEQVVGFPYFTVEAPAGTIIDVMPQEAHALGKNLWLDSQFFAWSRFICKEGINHFQTYDFESLRWLQLHIRPTNGPVKVSDVGIRRRLYDWPHEPDVSCSEPALQRLFEASINTLYNSCLDTCVDGMARERQQYSGDGGHQLLAVRSVLGETRLPKRFLRTFSEGQTSEGYFMDTWPAFDRLARVMQKQIDGAYWGPLLDHGVGFNFDCWYHYLETGDLAALDEVYPRLVKFADYLDTLKEPDGLLPVENLGIPTVWMDHIAFRKQRHKQCAFNLYVAAMLQNALTPLAEAKEDAENAAKFRNRGEVLLEKIVEKYWDSDRKTFVNNRPWLDEDKQPFMDDRSLATAILFGQCPGGDVAESLRLLVEQPPEMGYSYPCNACWRYWALCRLGRSDVVLKEFRDRWATMDSVLLNNTLAEDWAAQPDSGSQWSHCAVSPLFVLYSDIAGIRATAPGFTACEIRPQLADLGDLRLTYFTPQGPIRFEAKQKNSGGHIILVRVPKNCDAKLILREGDEGTIQQEERF